MMTKFLTAFFGFMFFALVVGGGVSGFIFLAIQITDYFGPYQNDNISSIFFVGILLTEIATVMGCVSACEDM
jgi:hypothetical protein